MRRLGFALLCVLVFGVWAWLIPGILYSNLPAQWLRVAAAGVFALAPAVALVALPNRKRTLLWTGGVCALVLVWWLTIPAPRDGEWAPEYARTPTAEIDGDRVTIHDIRDFEYRSETDFTPRYYDATYDLDELDTLDFLRITWGSPYIAHTMLSFGFSDGRHLAISVETRRRKGQAWSSFLGFFKQYTLAYVIGDERDLVRLRTNFRHEKVFLYPTQTPKQDIRIVFLDVLERANHLARRPEWYNTITDNCTTTLATHVRKVRGRRRWDPRLLVNGFTDEMVIEGGWVAPHGSLEETREYYYVNPKVENDSDPTDYSRKIRVGIE